MGHVTLTSYLSGARLPNLARLSADQLFELTYANLRALLGIKGQPTFKHLAFFPRAIPQYEVGFGRFRTLMKEIEAKASRFFLAGHYRDGVSLADSIISGSDAATRIQNSLDSSPKPPSLAQLPIENAA